MSVLSCKLRHDHSDPEDPRCSTTSTVVIDFISKLILTFKVAQEFFNTFFEMINFCTILKVNVQSCCIRLQVHSSYEFTHDILILFPSQIFNH